MNTKLKKEDDNENTIPSESMSPVEIKTLINNKTKRHLLTKSVSEEEPSESYVQVLHVIIKQKNEIAEKYKLVLKQQMLLNKLNQDNMRLGIDHNELKMQIKYQKFSIIDNNKTDEYIKEEYCFNILN
jgi:phosphoglycolate phosphatase-like HAD superfamily hydrolase